MVESHNTECWFPSKYLFILSSMVYSSFIWILIVPGPVFFLLTLIRLRSWVIRLASLCGSTGQGSELQGNQQPPWATLQYSSSGWAHGIAVGLQCAKAKKLFQSKKVQRVCACSHFSNPFNQANVCGNKYSVLASIWVYVPQLRGASMEK